MSTMTTPAATEESKAREVADAGPEPKQLDALHTAYGDTTITGQVVEKIAGIAAREVPGVYAMGSAAGRAFSSMSQRMPGQQQSVSGGVSIQKGERQTAIGVSIVVEYGVSIVEVADNIRDAVIKSVEYGTGLDVVSVDVQVTDVHLPAEYETDAGDRTPARAQQASPEPTRPPDALGAAGQVGTGTLTVGLASLDRQHSSAKEHRLLCPHPSSP